MVVGESWVDKRKDDEDDVYDILKATYMSISTLPFLITDRLMITSM